MECTDMREQLLDAWLNLSSTITNERLVSGFSYNEALVMKSALSAVQQRDREAAYSYCAVPAD